MKLDPISVGLSLPAGKDHKVDIPDTNRSMFPRFLVNQGYKVGVEIGVEQAHFLLRLANVGLKVTGVDPWHHYDGYRNKDYQERIDGYYEDAKEKVKDLNNVTLMRKTSMEAAEEFKNGSLDFVYIDGNHAFEYVAADIATWTKKVRKGGIIAGHDYASQRRGWAVHVKYVVDAYVKAFKIQRWFVLGRDERIPHERRENCRTWFWIKN